MYTNSTFFAFVIHVPVTQTNAPTTLPPEAEKISQTNAVTAEIQEPLPAPPPVTEMETENTFPTTLFFALIFTWLLIIGPGDYFLVRFLKRPWLTWITFPTWVILFIGFLYILGFHTQPTSTLMEIDHEPTTYQQQ